MAPSQLTIRFPAPGTNRWEAGLKAAVVAAVCSGEITPEEASRHYELSEDEFLSWRSAFESSGVKGLHASHLRQAQSNRSARRADLALSSNPGPQKASIEPVESSLRTSSGSAARRSN
jgi:transposase-like protein